MPALWRVPGAVRAAAGATTASYRVGETGEVEAVDLEQVVARGAALVIRAGGGRAGETFLLERDRLTVDTTVLWQSSSKPDRGVSWKKRLLPSDILRIKRRKTDPPRVPNFQDTFGTNGFSQEV